MKTEQEIKNKIKELEKEMSKYENGYDPKDEYEVLHLRQKLEDLKWIIN